MASTFVGISGYYTMPFRCYNHGNVSGHQLHRHFCFEVELLSAHTHSSKCTIDNMDSQPSTRTGRKKSHKAITLLVCLFPETFLKIVEQL